MAIMSFSSIVLAPASVTAPHARLQPQWLHQLLRWTRTRYILLCNIYLIYKQRKAASKVKKKK